MHKATHYQTNKLKPNPDPKKNRPAYVAPGPIALAPATDARPGFGLPVVAGTHLDITVTFEPPPPSVLSAAGGAGGGDEGGGSGGGAGASGAIDDACVGLVLQSWRPGGRLDNAKPGLRFVCV
jgi:hypothetical protein